PYNVIILVESTKVIIKLLYELKEQNKKILSYITSQNTAIGSNLLPDVPVELPLKNEQDINVFEQYLSKRENSFALCDYLSSVVGKDGTSLTNNILKRCLTNQLASSFSFRGKGVKKPFVDLSLKSVVVGAVKKQFSGLTEREIEDHIKVWLKHSPQRFKAETSDPFVIAVFCGGAKPSPLTSYLSDFIQELKHLLRNGLLFSGKTYSISIHSFVCDAPARAFLKCIKTHNGYSCCERCLEPGQYFNGRVVLTGISAPKRNNRSFRMQLDEEHHIGISPLVDLPIDLVIKYPIEYMHNGCSLLAKQLLDNFVKHSETRYGREFLVYNVHMLTHLSEDADVYGSLDNVSSFPFENYLGQLQKLIRCANNPLQQFCRRLSEINALGTRIISVMIYLPAMVLS
ncbi:hypothetical protein ILUMI_12451, partial [Ignelater luminosus]